MAIVDELIAILGYEITGEKELKKFEKSLDRVSNGIVKFATRAGRMAGIASTVVATGFGILGKSVIDTSAQFEVYQATLETIEGSQEKARASLEWINQFGKTTPYDVAQVTDSFVKLKAYGIDPIANDSLRVLGDTASAMGKPLTQAVEMFADAATGEFERLKEFGMKAKTQGDNVTFAWTKNGKELTKTVKKNSTEIRKFLLDTLGDRFAGAMDRQSKTWVGMMSNLGDTWTDFKRRIGEAGFFEAASKQLKRLLDYLGELDKNGTLQKWAENLSAAFTAVANFIAFMADRIIRNLKYLSENFESLKPYITAVGWALAGLIAFAFPLTTILVALAVAVDDFLTYMQGGESIIGDFIGWLKKLPEEIMKILTSLTELDPSEVGKKIGQLLGEAIVSGVKNALKLLNVALVDLPKTIASALIDVDWVSVGAAWIAGLKAQFLVLHGVFRQLGVTLAQAILEGLQSMGSVIKDWVANLIPKRLLNLMSGGGENSSPASNEETATEKENRRQGAMTAGPQGEQLKKLQAIAKNWETNGAKMGEDDSVTATITDSRQDNRSAPITSAVTVNQTVTTPVAATKAAAQAVGNASAAAVTNQRTQLQQEPAF